MEDPRPSSPTRPPKINVKVKRLDNPERQWNFGWFEIYASRRQIDFLIAERPVKWKDDNTLIIDGKVQVTTDAPPNGLSEIMEHEFTEKQRAWVPHALDMRQLVMIWMDEPRIPDWTETLPEAPTNAEARDAQRVAAKTAKLQEKADRKAAKATKEPKAPKTPKPSGLVDLATLFAGTDIEPKEARNALRKMGTPKPDHGRWEWDKKAAEAIKPKIAAMVKKLRK